MNYFAHAIGFLNQGVDLFRRQEPTIDPYFVAGTAIPDWMNVVNRKIRVRARMAEAYLEDPDPQVRSLAEGISQHHFDDQWFHETLAFNQLSLQFTVEIRDLLKPDPGFRPSFLGHILVELLLDAALSERYPGLLDEYYLLMQSVDPHRVEQVVSKIAGKNAEQLSWFVERFCEIRFLFDYTDDKKLMGRLNQVMQRVKLPRLPDSLLDYFDPARRIVAKHVDQLFLEPVQQHGTVFDSD